MNKMTKQTLLATSVALASMGATAAQVNVSSDFNVEIYGNAAISAFVQEKGNGYDFENESRVGFRVSKDMYENLNVFMQMETGNVGDDGSDGKFGVRDTFLGLQGDWGKVRFGRMLTPLYEIVDWPYSNPGLGRVFDGGGDVYANYDRHSNMMRYDSPNFAGFTFSLSTGRGNMVNSEDAKVGISLPQSSNHYGASAHYNMNGMLTLHAGAEYNTDRAQYGKTGQTFNSKTYLVGFELPLPAGFSVSGAYKHAEGASKSVNALAEQGSYSLIGNYWNGPWGFRLGYAANLESEADGMKLNDADEVVSGQLMYAYKGFLPYVRVGQTDAGNAYGKATDKTMFARVGLEYVF